MILQALCGFYDRMMEEYPESVAPFGFAITPVSQCIVLDREGNIVQVLDRMQFQEYFEKKGVVKVKAVPQRLLTPQQPKRSGKRPEPAFLCENANFLFGIYSDPDGADYRFGASRDLHELVLRGVEDEGASAILSFFSKRKKGSLDYVGIDTSGLEDGGNIVFQLEDDMWNYVHERPAIRKAWMNYLNSRSAEAGIGQCLVTGEVDRIARIHGNLDGFGQDKPTLVGFNKDSFVSYRKEQGENAPISESAAFKYVTALNLLINDRNHSININDEKVLFWAEKKAQLEEQIVGSMLNGEAGNWKLDEFSRRKLSGVMDHLYNGTSPEQLGLNANARFFVLGLSSNKTRAVIRYFYIDTFGQLVEKIRQHQSDIYVQGAPWEPEYPSISQILLETALRRESKNIPPPHQSSLIRSVISGIPYPNSLYMAMLGRIRAEASEDAGKAINRIRIGIIKGCINRSARQMKQMERVSEVLDPNEKAIPYRLGRLFAILNKAQLDALEKVNSSVVDKYLNAALASPQQVFPTLLANSRPHFTKIQKNYKGRYLYLYNLLLEVLGEVPTTAFPKTLNADEQGRFLVGFFHQEQVFYKRKDKEQSEEGNESVVKV
ncbi:type I-C CRISPR-associated protein Cas8c/Csd1 [Cohnella terricola]|uniref:Type I-C CRISPR-associated protein Cas8c/Csd1 n=1 Tax=Cohnella terricola TaxID=1289167 RepID=A0A559JEF5_9BACL|nr:type I-C CRISPR-associated protein Cas8c/Csd1 [Cohnella terricola]TVX98261.1 type I-C CRISPR-associated protein Cas8c/Csd1 [Cohnella terricola]